MKQRKPSDKYLDFLRNNKQEIENFNTTQDKIKEQINFYIKAGFTQKEIEEIFKPIALK